MAKGDKYRVRRLDKIGIIAAKDFDTREAAQAWIDGAEHTIAPDRLTIEPYTPRHREPDPAARPAERAAADVWLVERADLLAGFGATSSDTALARLAEELRRKAATGGAVHVVLEGVEDYLTGLRARMRDTERTRLTQVAAEIAHLTAERDDLVRRQVAWRDRQRDIAERARLSHTSVQRIRDAQDD